MHSSTTSSSTRFFSIPEMVLLASELLDEYQDLRSLSLCSHHTYRAATPFLWRTLSSPQPLLALFSAFRVRKSVYTFDGPIQISEVERFKRYATCVRRIRTFHLTHLDQRWIDPQCFEILARILQAPILPALQKVGMCIPLNKSLSPYTPDLWPTSNITSLSLVVDGQLAGQGFSILKACSDTLVKLSLGGRRCLDPSITDGVKLLKVLRVFVIDMAAPFVLGGRRLDRWGPMCASLPNTVQTIFINHPPSVLFPIISPLHGRIFRNLVITATMAAIELNSEQMWAHVHPDTVVSFFLSSVLEKTYLLHALSINPYNSRRVRLHAPFPIAVLRTGGPPTIPSMTETLEVMDELVDHVKFHEILLTLSSNSRGRRIEF